MNKNIILVGFGYMANRIANTLQQMQLSPDKIVYSLSRKDCIKPSWIKHIRFDLDKTVNQSFSKPEIFDQSSILYLVPPPATGKTDPRLFNFLSVIEQSAYLPEKIILISTTGVYGNCGGAWVDETSAVQPEVDRAYRRADAEKQLQDFCSKKSIICTILRVSGIYAEDKLPLERIKKQLPIVNENDSPYSNRIHAEDLTNICYQSLEQNHPGIFNCSDNYPTTMYDYFTRLATSYHLPTPPVIDMQQAQNQLSPGMLSYMQESRRINNQKLLKTFKIKLKYPSLSSFLSEK
ncbi:MAG: SDR family NAD(P)-dependent oxidoreductase [Pseudomonadota bacterium]